MGEFFSQTSLELGFFLPRYNGVRMFFQHYTSWAIFFSQEFTCKLFSSRNQSSGNFFLKSPITPSKVKWSAPGLSTDSDLSIISKGFWNNRGKSSLGERGRICFYLPLPGESARWRHNQIFLPMKLRCAADTPLGRTKTSDSSECITKPSDLYST